MTETEAYRLIENMLVIDARQRDMKADGQIPVSSRLKLTQQERNALFIVLEKLEREE